MGIEHRARTNHLQEAGTEMLLKVLGKHFSIHDALLPALHAVCYCQPVHIICNVKIEGGTAR